LDIIPGKHKASTLKGIKLGCENKKENILKNIDEIRNISHKPKLLSKEYLLSHDPDFPVEKFLPESINPKEKKEEKEEKEEEKKEEKKEEEKKGKGKEKANNDKIVLLPAEPLQPVKKQKKKRDRRIKLKSEKDK
jgi:hypothetical protein